MVFGEVVHPGAGGEISGVLLSTVQHDNQRHRRTGVAGRDVEVVASGPGPVSVVEVADLTAGRGRGCGRTGPCHAAAGGGRVAGQVGQSTGQPRAGFRGQFGP